MNYANEEDYIKAINDNPENRDYQLLFAEYLQEKGEDNLAEGWRVLIERGKSPAYWPGVPSMPEDYRGWNWFAIEKLDQHLPSTTLLPSANLYSEITFLVKGDKGGGSKYKLNPDLQPAFLTFFGAMQAAAIAYVRYKYDENYGKPVIHFVAYKGGDKGTETNMDCFFDWEEREGPGGRISRRPTLQSNHVSYTNLGYDPEESYLIRQAIIDGEPILVEIELEDVEKKVDCPGCERDWGHSYCGVCGGKGFLIRRESDTVKAKARITSFETLPDNLCNVELTTEKEEKKQCTRCDGTGFVLSDEDRRIRPIDEHPPESAIVYECSNCNGTGFIR